MLRDETRLDIIVLGRRLGEGGRPTDIFRRRLDKAYAVYREKKKERVPVARISNVTGNITVTLDDERGNP